MQEKIVNLLVIKYWIEKNADLDRIADKKLMQKDYTKLIKWEGIVYCTNYKN